MHDSPKPTLVLFCGLPGSGKTTLAKQLELQGRGIRVCTDDWQDDLGMAHNADNFHEKLQAKLYAHTLELLRHGQSVILEDGLWMEQERAVKLSDAAKQDAKTQLHFFDLTFNEVWQRLQARNQNLSHGTVKIGKEQLKKCWDLFEKPTPDELGKFDEVFVYTDSSKPPGAEV